jgi:hypothetical protein
MHEEDYCSAESSLVDRVEQKSLPFEEVCCDEDHVWIAPTRDCISLHHIPHQFNSVAATPADVSGLRLRSLRRLMNLEMLFLVRAPAGLHGNIRID